ncbi:MAG: FGGY family carbohydrate kinase [Oscillospiraceae bacterium]|nr:FGGY family carbohydrate kinase [Oscillospiraceae bacterium]
MALIGIDVGGTGAKAVAYAYDGTVLKYAYKEYTMKNPEPGAYMFDPRELRETVDSIVREVVIGCGEEVVGIGCTTFGESFVCFDGDDNIMCDSIMYFDTRGEDSIKEFSAIWQPEKTLEAYGFQAPNRISSLVKMHVMNKADPGFFSRVKKIRMLPDFVLSGYGGGHMCDDSIASTTGCYNYNTGEWIPEMLKWAGVDPAIMPKIVPIGSIIGEAGGGGAAWAGAGGAGSTGSTGSGAGGGAGGASGGGWVTGGLGAMRGAKLVPCGHDHTAASLGVGMCRAGQMMNEIGTVDIMMMLIGEDDLPKLEAMAQSGGRRPMRPRRHVTRGNYVMGAGGGGLTGGAILKWFRDHFGLYEKAECARDGLSFYAEYDKKIPAEPTNLIVLPQFGTGAPGRNQIGGILNMTMATTNEQIYRAFMECQSYAVYTGFKRVNENMRKVDDIIALGGGANSAEYMQIRSDVFNVPIKTTMTEQGGTYGSAMLAGVAAGIWGSIEEAIDATVRINQVFEPNPANHAYYMEMYEKYMKVQSAVNDALYPLS